MRAVVVILLAALLLGALAPPALAQGCAMCRTAGAGMEEAQQRALDLGILVLLIPTAIIFSSVLFVAVRRKNRNTLDRELEVGPTSARSSRS